MSDINVEVTDNAIQIAVPGTPALPATALRSDGTLQVGDLAVVKSLDPVVVEGAGSGTYRQVPDVVRLYPERFTGVFGAPTLGNFRHYAAWSMAVNEYIATDLDIGDYGDIHLPASWSTFDIKIIGFNVGTGSGDVTHRMHYDPWSFGDALPGTLTAPARVTTTAGSQWVTQTITLATGLSVPAEGSVFSFRIFRDSTDDTLANEYGIKRVLLEKAS